MTSAVPLPHANPEDMGFDPDLLQSAVSFATSNDSRMNRDIGAALADGHFDEPWPIGKTIGPVKNRADPSGMILRKGHVVTSWGDTARVDMTFSISKSYLALLLGIAVGDRMIPSLDDPVGNLVKDGGFDSLQNRDITWRHLFQLTSEWEGTLWDKPDWIDHNRDVMGTGSGGKKGVRRDLQTPGSHWEYNDVRVNRASLALMHVFGRPLPDVLRERIMDPIGASRTWEWHGYDNSFVDVGGQRIQSVPGGAHWGGGLWVSSEDHARIGQLMLGHGMWEGVQVLPGDWVSCCTTPCKIAPWYGLMWWLNASGHKIFPSAGPEGFFAIGVGTNLIWVDPDQDLVMVCRWIRNDAVDDLIRKVRDARR